MEKKILSKQISDRLVPSIKVREVAGKAAGMGTTLWFTEAELERERMLDSLIACGQFTTCWNLLEYIEKIKTNSENTNSNHSLFIDCEDQLYEHWKIFQKDPYWLSNEYTERVLNNLLHN